jgi:hypothetical protein
VDAGALAEEALIHINSTDLHDVSPSLDPPFAGGNTIIGSEVNPENAAHEAGFPVVPVTPVPSVIVGQMTAAQQGTHLLVLTVMLLLPGEKDAGFLLSMFALVAVVAGCLAWAVYRRRSGPEGPPEEEISTRAGPSVTCGKPDRCLARLLFVAYPGN